MYIKLDEIEGEKHLLRNCKLFDSGNVLFEKLKLSCHFDQDKQFQYICQFQQTKLVKYLLTIYKQEESYKKDICLIA